MSAVAGSGAAGAALLKHALMMTTTTTLDKDQPYDDSVATPLGTVEVK